MNCREFPIRCLTKSIDIKGKSDYKIRHTFVPCLALNYCAAKCNTDPT